MKLVPLSEINDSIEFWRGTRFRLYEIGLNVPEELDYYEYMLAVVPGDSEYMLLTCVEGYKSGSALALVKTEIGSGKRCVTAKSMKYSMGVDNVYLLDDSE
ncbi:MAG: hypothetical protein H6599_02475 [Flavobacteriales bacterium]|nr:hypothetical protein [Flavobacteriales bacterium]